MVERDNIKVEGEEGEGKGEEKTKEEGRGEGMENAGKEKNGKCQGYAGNNRKMKLGLKKTSESFSSSKIGSEMLFENLVWMTSAEAAVYLRKSYGALRVMVCRGYIQPRIFHRRWYFRRNELDRLIENSL